MKRMLAIACLASLSQLSLADTIYVSNEKDDTLSVIDSDTLEVIKTIEVGMRPRGIIFNQDYMF